MDIVQYINTPLGTPGANPLETIVKLTKGRITGGSIYFPSGPAGKLHFIARIGLHQIIPLNPSQNLMLDDCLVPLSMGFDLVEPPFELICETWNDSTLYDHSLTLLLYIEPMLDKDHDIKTLINKFWFYGGQD